MSLRGKFPQTPILCYVTDRKSLGSQGAGHSRTELLRCITAAARAGVAWIQIREKDLSGKEISLIVRDVMVLARQTQRDRPPRVLVNDRLDVALAEHAGGVHLGENSLPTANVSQWLGWLPNHSARQDFLVGVSCHSLNTAMKAERDGAGYIFFGPVFSTPSKAVFGEPQGLSRLEEVCAAVSIPVLAIGGITIENASSCVKAGAAGIAAIRLFQVATDLPALLQQLRATF